MDGLLDGNLVCALAARKLGAKGASILPAADDDDSAGVGFSPPQSDESSADDDDEGSSPKSVREAVVCRCLGLGLWVGVGVGFDLADLLFPLFLLALLA